MGLLADAARVEITATSSLQACTPLDTAIEDSTARCPAGQFPLHSRPPLQVDTTINGTPYVFYVNHLKSKREGEVETAAWRLAQATHLASLVAAKLQEIPGTAILVIGDFNDLPLSPSLQRLQTHGPLTDPLRALPASTRYTYIFGGYAELLDNILLSPVAWSRMAGAGIVHMNADFPYTWATDSTTPYRASDHDVPWVTLQIQPAATPVPTPRPVASATIASNPPAYLSPPAATRAPQQPQNRAAFLVPALAAVALAGAASIALAVFRRR